MGKNKKLKRIFTKETQLAKKVSPLALTIFDQGGIPLTSSSNEQILQGGLFTAINSFIKESFNSELNQLKMGGKIIIFNRSKHLMGSIVLTDKDGIDPAEAEEDLHELLCHLENMCPELESHQLDIEKIEFLVNQYSSNLL